MQILLDEDRYDKVARAAELRGLSIAAVIREAIDLLPDNLARRRAAISAILSAKPIPVPADPKELKREIAEAHDHPIT